MADFSPENRFSNATEFTIEQLKKGSKNENTLKSTSFWLSVWLAWCENKKVSNEIHKYDPIALNKLLEQFYAEVRSKNGKEYEPDSLKVMIAAIRQAPQRSKLQLVNHKR